MREKTVKNISVPRSGRSQERSYLENLSVWLKKEGYEYII